jgi:hypothetical protein
MLGNEVEIMPGEWRYALKPLPVDPEAKRIAGRRTAPRPVEVSRREPLAYSPVPGSAEEHVRRIVRGLRARETQPDPREQDGPDDDPVSRN